MKGRTATQSCVVLLTPHKQTAIQTAVGIVMRMLVEAKLKERIHQSRDYVQAYIIVNKVISSRYDVRLPPCICIMHNVCST